MRGVNFGCSLIVLSMLATSFTIFNATRALPDRNGMPAWAPETPIWPQITLLTIACVSLIFCVVIFYGYWRGGHRRAEKVAVYYTTFAVAFFVFSIIMWGVGAAILNQSRNNGQGKDMWGWSCKQNKRREVFQNDVDYDLVCRLQNWSLICCIIEVVIEVVTIAIYGITFYRYYSKRRLRKTMQARDKARSDLYLAQLKSQSAPNTPGILLSPRDGGWQPPQGYDHYNAERKAALTKEDELDDELDDEHDRVQYAVVGGERKVSEPKPFALQAPPSKKKGDTASGNASLASGPVSPVSPVANPIPHIEQPSSTAQYS